MIKLNFKRSNFSSSKNNKKMNKILNVQDVLIHTLQFLPIDDIVWNIGLTNRYLHELSQLPVFYSHVLLTDRLLECYENDGDLRELLRSTNSIEIRYTFQEDRVCNFLLNHEQLLKHITMHILVYSGEENILEEIERNASVLETYHIVVNSYEVLDTPDVIEHLENVCNSAVSLRELNLEQDVIEPHELTVLLSKIHNLLKLSISTIVDLDGIRHISKLTTLEYLSLRVDQRTDVSSLINCTNLKLLKLDIELTEECDIGTIIQPILGFTEIHLSCSTESNHSDYFAITFSEQKHLESISKLEFNGLFQLPNIPILPELTDCRFDLMSLETEEFMIDSELFKQPKVTHLCVENVDLMQLSDQLNGYASQIVYLRIAETYTTSFNTNALNEMKCLTTLDLSGNELSECPDVIFNLKKLQHLYLQNNAIAEFPSGLSTLPELRDINIAYNTISELPDDFYKLFLQCDTVLLAGNPLLKDTTVQDQENIYNCHSGIIELLKSQLARKWTNSNSFYHLKYQFVRAIDLPSDSDSSQVLFIVAQKEIVTTDHFLHKLCINKNTMRVTHQSDPEEIFTYELLAAGHWFD
jgi:Leucine-rich repeat (LRR) protein